MTATADTSRATLLKSLKEQWQRSEIAVRRCEDAFNAPATDQWTVGDIFRHLVGVAHRLAPDMLTAIFRAGEVPADNFDNINAEDVAKFKALSAKMLQIELSVAHGTLWMFLQRYSDEDLARRIKTSGNELSFGEFLERLCGTHERQHAEEAFKAAGSKLKAPVPFHSWS